MVELYGVGTGTLRQHRRHTKTSPVMISLAPIFVSKSKVSTSLPRTRDRRLTSDQPAFQKILFGQTPSSAIARGWGKSDTPSCISCGLPVCIFQYLPNVWKRYFDISAAYFAIRSVIRDHFRAGLMTSRHRSVGMNIEPYKQRSIYSLVSSRNHSVTAEKRAELGQRATICFGSIGGIARRNFVPGGNWLILLQVHPSSEIRIVQSPRPSRKVVDCYSTKLPAGGFPKFQVCVQLFMHSPDLCQLRKALQGILIRQPGFAVASACARFWPKPS